MVETQETENKSGTLWNVVRDGDSRIRGIYERHYSARKNGATIRGAHSWNRICGPGEHLILLTPLCDALFVWILQRYRADNQVGVNCAVFRNEGFVLSSILIHQAEVLARERWPLEWRLFTFIDGNKIRSTNPGYCFVQAGWRRCGLSNKGLVILEKCK